MAFSVGQQNGNTAGWVKILVVLLITNSQCLKEMLKRQVKRLCTDHESIPSMFPPRPYSSPAMLIPLTCSCSVAPGRSWWYIIWLLPTFVSGCILCCIAWLSGFMLTRGTHTLGFGYCVSVADPVFAGLFRYRFVAVPCYEKVCKILLREVTRKWIVIAESLIESSNYFSPLFSLLPALETFTCTCTYTHACKPTRLSWRLFVFVTLFSSDLSAY